MVILQRKLHVPKDPEGVQHFPGGWGGPTFFQGGPTFLLISIETHIACGFPGGGGSRPLSPSGSAHTEIEKCTGVNLKVNIQGLKYLKI